LVVVFKSTFWIVSYGKFWAEAGFFGFNTRMTSGIGQLDEKTRGLKSHEMVPLKTKCALVHNICTELRADLQKSIYYIWILSNFPCWLNFFLSFRADSELVLDNIFRIFDPDETGSVRFNELLMAFSMSMRGSGQPKLTHCSLVSPNPTLSVIYSNNCQSKNLKAIHFWLYNQSWDSYFHNLLWVLTVKLYTKNEKSIKLMHTWYFGNWKGQGHEIWFG